MTRRTKHSVEAGIVWTSAAAAGRSIVVEYQPGNGTRYVVSFTELSGLGPRTLDGMGFEAGAVVVLFSWINAGKSWAMRDSGFLAGLYLAEKLRCSADDGAVLAELIAHYTNRVSACASDVPEVVRLPTGDAMTKPGVEALVESQLSALVMGAATVSDSEPKSCDACAGTGLGPPHMVGIDPCPECQGEGVRRASS